ncbi:hypothetical protein FHY09_002784 [Xanthomonas sp. 60]
MLTPAVLRTVGAKASLRKDVVDVLPSLRNPLPLFGL